MAAPTVDPVWVRIHQAMVVVLKGINSSSGSYFNTIRKVYDFEQDQWDKSNIPGLACYPAPGSVPRTYEGGSRTVSASQPFVIYGMIQDDRADGVGYATRAYRLVSDIHRAIYAQPRLGVAEVKRVYFLATPLIQPYLLATKTSMVEIRYGCTVEHGCKDDAP